MPFVGRKLGSQEVIAPPVGDPQLAGLLCWAYAKHDTTNGLLPGDGTIVARNSVVVGDYNGEICWRSSVERSSPIVDFNVNVNPRSPLVVHRVYHDFSSSGGSAKRTYSIPNVESATGLNTQWSNNDTERYCLTSFNSSGRADCWDDRGNFPMSTWFQYAAAFDNTVDGGNGLTRQWYNQTEYGYGGQQTYTGLMPASTGILHLLNYNGENRSFKGGVTDFRVYDLEDMDPSYATIEDLLTDIWTNPDRAVP